MRILLTGFLLLTTSIATAANAPQQSQSADVPSWDNSAIEAMYDVYLHPAQHQLPKIKDQKKYNTLFLDAYWGPITNPFSKYARPSKVFVYIDNAPAYMAPIIKNATDNNLYVFNLNSDRPLLLDTWLDQIKSHAQGKVVKLTICNSYGNSNTADTCTKGTYEAEQGYALNIANDTVRFNATNKAASASRALNEDWHRLAPKVKMMAGASESKRSIYDSSIDWNDVSERKALLLTTTPWLNYQTIQDNFEKIRDLRYFTDTKKTGFLRRISWLYPDDGCWTRASAVVNHLFGAVDNPVSEFARPSKIFAFGNLCANTPNSSGGYVSWWYHTAPLIRDAQTNQTYVLDPSVGPKKPMTIEAWIAAISSNTGACQNSYQPKVEKINVCTGFGAGPSNNCSDSTYTDEAREALRQNTYQGYERSRQVELGRDADKVLGDEAPWL